MLVVEYIVEGRAQIVEVVWAGANRCAEVRETTVDVANRYEDGGGIAVVADNN